MKKIFLIISIFISVLGKAQFPFSYWQNSWDVDASAYLSHFTDMPPAGRLAVTQLVLDLKRYSLWAKMKFALIAPATMDETQAYRDLKSNTVLSTAFSPAGVEGYMGIYPQGYYVKEAGSINSYIKTGVSLSTLGVTTGSACFMWGENFETPGGTGYDFGVAQAAGQRVLCRLRDGVSTAFCVYPGDNASTTRLIYGPIPGKKDIWTLNRTSSTYLELVKGTTILATNTVAYSSPSVPTLETYISAYNNAGTATAWSQGTRDFWVVFSGLTSTERNNAYTCFDNYRTHMNRNGNSTKQVILDGNSLGESKFQRLFRRGMFNLGLNNVEVHNMSVSGQTTTTKLANYHTLISPMYKGSYAKNIYCLLELGNDIYTGVSTTTAKNNAIHLIDSARNSGFIAVLFVPWARTYVGNTGGLSATQFNLAMDEMVQWARTPANSHADYVVNVTDQNLWVDRSLYASDAAYNTGISIICANATYYTDGTHNTPAGFDIQGAVFAIVLAGIL